MTPDEFWPRGRDPVPTAWLLLGVLLLAALAWFAGMRQAEDAGRVGVRELSN
jgi:hypothetical protein